MSLRNLAFWIFISVSILFFGFLAFASFTEWYTVAVKKETGLYPWGDVNNNAWFYESPATYGRVMLAEAILLTAGTIPALIFSFRKERFWTFCCTLGLWLLFAALWVNGQVQ